MTLDRVKRTARSGVALVRRRLWLLGSIAPSVVVFAVVATLAALSEWTPLEGFVGAFLTAGVTLLVLLAVRANRQVDRAVTVAQLAASRAAAAQVTPLLYQKIDPPYPLPPLGDQVLDANVFMFVADWIARRRPRLLVELGSGASTAILAHLMKRVGGRVISIEHDAQWVERTREEVRQWNLEDTAAVRHVALTKTAPPGAYAPWYDPAALDAALAGGQIDFLIVDGPPGRTGRLVRYPALPELQKRLVSGGAILLDDCQRTDEREILQRWRAARPDLDMVLIRGNKPAAVLIDRGPSQ